jgi:hypothetical protein
LQRHLPVELSHQGRRLEDVALGNAKGRADRQLTRPLRRPGETRCASEGESENMKKMKTIGTELELEALAHVQGGMIIYDPKFDPKTININWKQVEEAGKAVVEVAKKVWHTITSWF